MVNKTGHALTMQGVKMTIIGLAHTSPYTVYEDYSNLLLQELRTIAVNNPEYLGGLDAVMDDVIEQRNIAAAEINHDRQPEPDDEYFELPKSYECTEELPF